MDKNLIQRLITGTIFVIVLVGCIMWNEWSFGALFLLITILGVWEFYGLIEKTEIKPQKYFGIIGGVVLFSLTFCANYFSSYLYHGSYLFPKLLFSSIIVFLFGTFFIELFRNKQNPFSNIAFTILGWIYVALPFMLWCGITAHPYIIQIDSPWIPSYANDLIVKPWHPLLGFFIIIWTSDSMAYVCGRLFGKHKLFERISPKKTWEGFIGGLAFAVLAGYIISMFYHEMNALHWMILSVIVSVTGMFGDLVESMLKRSLGVKDSGTILPGHGGILDRFDAVLLASPFVVSFYLFFGK